MVYILTNWNNKVMYIGVTNNLPRRLEEHKLGMVDGFTKKYVIHKLVYFETGPDINSAIAREKELKSWRRSKKDALVKLSILNGKTSLWIGRFLSKRIRNLLPGGRGSG